MKIVNRLLFAWSLALAACSSGSTPLTDGGGGGDDGTKGDGGTGMVPDAGTADVGNDGGVAMPIPGGGAGGGPIDGHIVVFVIDHQTHVPISGAVVEVDATPNPLMAMTGADGRADISGPNLKGPANITVFATSYPYQTVVGINAQIVSFEPDKMSQATPPIATIAGNVTGWDLLPMPTSTTSMFRFGSVNPINKHLLDSSNTITQDNRALAPVPTNIAVQNQFEDYSVKVSPSATAGVFVLGGILTLHRMTPPGVQISHAGFLPGLTVMKDMVLSGQNVAFTHPVDQNLQIAFGDAPNLATKQAVAVVALPQNGGFVYIGAVTASRTGTASVMVPALTGALSGGGYVAGGILREGTQNSVALTHSSQTLNIQISGFLAPPTMIAATGRTVSAMTPSATVTSFAIAKNMQTLWTVNAVSAASSVTFPAVPSGFTDPLTGLATVLVSAVRLENIDLNNSSAADYSDHTQAVASNNAAVMFGQ